MLRFARCLLTACLVLALAPLAPAADDESGAVPQAREQLVGAWRLMSITRITSQGSQSDPFYGEHCSGLIIYDAAGWVSVQIVAASRPSLPTPDSRKPGTAKDEQRESGLFDTYYAYFGTWTYEASRGVVTHAVVSSLYPSEQALNYAQEVRLRGSQMIFTVRHPSPKGETRQVKIWERITAAD